MLHQVLSLSERAIAATTAGETARLLAADLERAGASYVQLRLYQRPGGMLTSASHWRAGGVLIRQAAPDWEGSSGFNYICFEQNPLLQPIRQGLTRYRFSDFAPRGDRRFGRYWDALGSAAIAEGICATAYGRGGTIASAHVGVATPAIDPALADAIAFASSMVCEKLIGFAMPAARPAGPRLSQRERDVLGFVADGKTDWEIATILGIAATTARFHVDNARRKLNANSRSHAVARLLADDGRW